MNSENKRKETGNGDRVYSGTDANIVDFRSLSCNEALKSPDNAE